MRRLPALLLVATACGRKPELGPTTHGVQDTGALCFTSSEDGSIQLIVTFDTCLSSSCDRVLGTECHIAESADVITVSSSATFQRESLECTPDCRAMTARCAAPPLPPGTYAVEYGGALSDLTLPARQVELFEDVRWQVTCP